MREFFTSQFGVSITFSVMVIGALLGITTYCIYFERKIAGWVQDRYGPNRVGPAGIFQLVADGIKMVFKEDIIPGHVDKVLFLAAPAIIIIVSFIGFAAIPWGGQWELDGHLVNIQVANPDIGLLYILGVASMAIYGLVLGGYSSNNKYSLFGSLRATAQMLSYEIPLGLCILVVVLTLGTLRLEHIALAQTGYWFGIIPQWNVFLHPVPFVILLITSLAESNRTPFDLPEAEQELVCGYHTEYTALKFGMFFLGEYAHMITASALISVLFLGGWHFPWIPWAQPEATSFFAVLVKIGVLGGKVVFFIFLMMWLRWTLPRFRWDQLMRVAWKGLIPITLALFILTAVLVYFGLERSIWTLVGNVVIVAGALLIAGSFGREVTGRTTNLPPIPSGPFSPGVGGVGASA
ncbi:MAG: NADH-quinone oxidoreductase subunit NuoH [Phycisphaerales bacterium]|nr:MAG: NADH-quinone oxidoreductase subunit NuoH [Phycisphaerales bacterium]